MNKEFHELQQLLKKLPGIGEKQAERIVYYFLRQDRNTLVYFSRTLINLKENVLMCSESCHLFIPHSPSEIESPYLHDSERDTTKVLVVEKQNDIELWDTVGWRGVYYVIDRYFTLKNQDDDRTKRDHFSFVIKKWRTKFAIKEVTFATSFTRDAEYTEMSLAASISEFCRDNDIIISRLGRGISSGSEISYMDTETLKNAIDNKH